MITNNEIKTECETLYQQIKDAHIRLEELRKICKHEETIEGNYSPRIGQIFPATICNFCNEPIKFQGFDSPFE